MRPPWTRTARWLVCLAITAGLGASVGRPWTFVWLIGLPAVGATFHVWWCRRHCINPLAAELRDRYEQLRRRPARATGSRCCASIPGPIAICWGADRSTPETGNRPVNPLVSGR